MFYFVLQFSWKSKPKPSCQITSSVGRCLSKLWKSLGLPLFPRMKSIHSEKPKQKWCFIQARQTRNTLGCSLTVKMVSTTNCETPQKCLTSLVHVATVEIQSIKTLVVLLLTGIERKLFLGQEKLRFVFLYMYEEWKGTEMHRKALYDKCGNAVPG